MTPTVLTVNPGFGVLKKQADALLFSLYGEVKLLRGAVGSLTTFSTTWMNTG